jgi:type VI protein secretion system component VasK
VELTTATAVVFWGLLAILAVALLTYGIRRDQKRPVKAVGAVALVCSLLLVGAAAFVGWGAYQQQRAESNSCEPLSDC